MLKRENTALVVIDVQGNLADSMYKKEELYKNLQILIEGSMVLAIPVIWLEQNPEKLGPTIPELQTTLSSGRKPISKMCFSCLESAEFKEELEKTGRKQVLIAGIEAHVCVYQTASALVEAGYEVQVVTDAISSRTSENKEIGMERIKESGAGLTSTETALFELLEEAGGDDFRKILKLVK